MHGNRFDVVLARVYYAVGLLYYISHYIALAGIVVMGGAVLLRPAYYHDITIICGVVVVWAANAWIKSRKSQRCSQNPHFYHILEETIYSSRSSPDYSCTKHLRLKALHDMVDHYEWRFNWTGRGKVSVGSISQPEQTTATAELHEESYGTRRLAKISFGRPLKKGEIIDFSFTLILTDDSHTARPFVSEVIKTKIDKWIARVYLPEGVTDYVTMIYETDVSAIPLFEQKASVDIGSNEARWEIRRPRLYRKYQLRWG